MQKFKEEKNGKMTKKLKKEPWSAGEEKYATMQKWRESLIKIWKSYQDIHN